jgi:ABC-type multidrug transport system fused ATPase/permease subunit
LLALNSLYAVVNVVTTYVGPYLIDDFVEYLGGRRRFAHEGITLVLVFFVAKLINNLTERQWEFGEQYLGLKIKSALTAVVYRKAIRLSSQSRRSHTSGEIINYMAVDVERVSESAWCLPYFWILPLQIFLALVILDKVVGIAWLAALVAAIFALCLNVPIEKMQESYEDKAMEAKDSRMKAMVECLRNMRVLKLQAWENQYLAKIEEIRLGEYHWLLKACVARALLSYVFWLTPTLVSLATFGMCVALGIPLTAGRILSAVATFRVLQQALNMFPDLVSYYAQTKVKTPMSLSCNFLLPVLLVCSLIFPCVFKVVNGTLIRSWWNFCHCKFR